MRKYGAANPKLKEVQEPMAAYLAPSTQINILSGMSAADLGDTHLTGQALTKIQKETALSPKALADVVGVSKSKYYDLLKVEELSLKNVDALADFATIWQKGLEAFDGNQSHLNEWLETRNENLGGIPPIDLLSTRIGRRELEKAFYRIEHSTYG
ncbi:MAG: DUF2384 domain-containing protein [Cyclobacteriaceae bacterium]